MNMCSRILTLLTSCFLLISSAHAQIEPNPVALEGASSYTYKTIGDIELRLHVFGASSDSPTPAIVFFFGGGWRNGSINQFVPQSLHLSERGMTANGVTT